METSVWVFEDTIGAIKNITVTTDKQSLVVELEPKTDLAGTLQTACISIPLTGRNEFCAKITELLRVRFGAEIPWHQLLEKGIVENAILIPMPFRIYPGTNVTIYAFRNEIYHSVTLEVK